MSPETQKERKNLNQISITKTFSMKNFDKDKSGLSKIQNENSILSVEEIIETTKNL